MTNNSITTTEFEDSTIKLIRDTVAFGATPNEFSMFIYQAKKSGLDPLARQIYFVKRGEKATIQASIDGLRLVAQRNGLYAGQDEPVFEETQAKLKIAKVTVYKFAPNGQRYPAAVGVAYWDEYCPSYNGKVSPMWVKMPHTMLAKCAEALALRKAFPQELSGLYTAEEMAQAGDAKPMSKSALNRQAIDEKLENAPVGQDSEEWLNAEKDPQDHVQAIKEMKKAKEEAEISEAEVLESFTDQPGNVCSECKRDDVKENVQQYSSQKYGRVLCFNCQNKFKQNMLSSN